MDPRIAKSGIVESLRTGGIAFDEKLMGADYVTYKPTECDWGLKFDGTPLVLKMVATGTDSAKLYLGPLDAGREKLIEGVKALIDKALDAKVPSPVTGVK